MSTRDRPARRIGQTTAIAWRAVPVLLVLVVMVLALSPTVPREISFGWDKLDHIAAFFVLTIAWRLGYPGNAWRWLQLAMGLMVLGAAIEVAQIFVPGREADAADLLTDGIGVAAGMAVVAAMEWRQRRRMSLSGRPRAR